ncbi:MAG: MSHA biogenesis protein MshI [Aeromonadaceae bacterium]
MMEWFRRLLKPKQHNALALALGQECVLLVQLYPTPLFLREPCQGQAEWPRAIAALLNRVADPNCEVLVLLAPAFYQQVQIEKPDVPEEELAGALPWAIKDFVSEPVLQLSCDYYDMPTSPASHPKLAVVAVNKNRLQLIADSVNAHARLSLITTEELALANLPSQEAKIELMLYQLPGQELSLLALSGGQLCFNRQLRGFSQLGQPGIVAQAPELLDNLALQLQRSLDYLSGQLKLGEATRMQVALASGDLGSLVHYLASNFSMPVVALANPAVVAGLEYLPAFALLQGEGRP